MDRCPYCGSTRLRKSGKLPNGSQRYICKKCCKGFNENTKTKEPLNRTCPYCGSTRMRKAGHNKSGTQRYYCNDCGRKSCDKEVQTFFADINTDIECPHCHSHNLKKGGHLDSGAQRYICKDCSKYFSDKTILKPDLGLTCPTCGSHDIGTCGVEKGKQRYRCKTCKRRFITDYEPRDFKKYEKECPRCGHKLAKAAGHTGDGKPYFKCLECGHKYLENPVFRQTTEEQKQRIRQLYQTTGQTRQEIADLYGISVKTVYHITKDCLSRKEKDNERISKLLKCGYGLQELAQMFNRTESSIACLQEKVVREEQLSKAQQNKILEFGVFQEKPLREVAKIVKCTAYNCIKFVNNYLKNETLTKEQKNMLYTYGIMLNVPIKYLTPYIKCSKNKCSQFLTRFDKIPIKRNPVTEKERYFDRLELDKFIA